MRLLGYLFVFLLAPVLVTAFGFSLVSWRSQIAEELAFLEKTNDRYVELAFGDDGAIRCLTPNWDPPDDPEYFASCARSIYGDSARLSRVYAYADLVLTHLVGSHQFNQDHCHLLSDEYVKAEKEAERKDEEEADAKRKDEVAVKHRQDPEFLRPVWGFYDYVAKKLRVPTCAYDFDTYLYLDTGKEAFLYDNILDDIYKDRFGVWGRTLQRRFGKPSNKALREVFKIYDPSDKAKDFSYEASERKEATSMAIARSGVDRDRPGT